MNKKTLFCGLLLVLVTLVAFADVKKISRAGNSTMIAQGGTNTTSALPVIVSGDSNTNEYSFVSITATVTGTDTAYTNTFTTPYAATPLMVRSLVSGVLSSQGATATPTISATTFIVSGLSTNAASATNNLTFIIYGYKNTGTFP